MTPEQYVNLISNYGDQLIAKKDEFEIPAIEDLQGNIRIRVNNQGADNAGNVRNYKSKAYKKRFKKVDPVNMILTGDLDRDYNAGPYKNSGDNVLGFRDEKNIDKVLGEEKRRSGKLYNPSDKEISQFKNQLTRFITRFQKRILNV